MVRVLRNSQGQYAVDKTGKMNGRGAYICNARECAQICVAKKGLDRSFKEKIDKEVYNLLLKAFEETLVKEEE